MPLTPKQVAERLGVSVGLVYGWCGSGLLAHHRAGAKGRRGRILVEESDLAAFWQGRKVGAATPPVGPAPPPTAVTPAARRPAAPKHLRL